MITCSNCVCCDWLAIASTDAYAFPKQWCAQVRFLLESATASNMSNVINELRQQLRLSPTEYGIGGYVMRHCAHNT
jgi:hypothetical protein